MKWSEEQQPNEQIRYNHVLSGDATQAERRLSGEGQQDLRWVASGEVLPMSLHAKPSTRPSKQSWII